MGIATGVVGFATSATAFRTTSLITFRYFEKVRQCEAFCNNYHHRNFLVPHQQQPFQFVTGRHCIHHQQYHYQWQRYAQQQQRQRRFCNVVIAQQQEQQASTSSVYQDEGQQKGVALQSREWNPVNIVENSEACEEHRYIVINIGITGNVGTCCDAYRYPGQYVKFRRGIENEKNEVYLAMACAPNIQGYFEFLVKETEGNAWFCNLGKGSVVEMSPVLGKGFGKIGGVGEVENVLLFATGSGIAPIRATIESLLNGVNPRIRKRVKLYYGARYPSRMAFRDRLGLWEEDGVEIVQVMSRPGEDGIEWGGKTGYVQNILEEDGVQNPEKTAALLCGVKGMIQDVKHILQRAGVPEQRILLNY